MFCDQCGQPVKDAYCDYCGREIAIQQQSQSGNALDWPFRQANPLSSLWMPLMWWVLPPFSGLIALGWSVDAIRRKGRRYPQRLPQTRDLASILKYGFVVTAMAVIYFVIPLSILATLVQWSWLEQAREFFMLLWNILLHRPHESFVSYLWKKIFEVLVDATTPLIYICLATPMFLAARIRYALTGKVRSFFNIFGNAVTCFRHAGGMLLYAFLAAVTKTVIVFIGGIVAGTVVGLIVPFLLGGASIWLLADLAGNIAAAMFQREGIGRHALVPVQTPTPVAMVQPFQPHIAPPAPVKALPLPRVVQAEERIPVPRRFAPVLYCQKGPLCGDSFPVPEAGFYIGRSPQFSHLIVDLPEVSSRHARVLVDIEAGGVWLEDMDSSNGTYYYSAAGGGWQPVLGRQRLNTGDRFQLSKGAAEFQLGEA